MVRHEETSFATEENHHDNHREIFTKAMRHGINCEIEAELEILRIYNEEHGSNLRTGSKSVSIQAIISMFESLQDEILSAVYLRDIRMVGLKLDHLKKSQFQILNFIFERMYG